METGSSHALIYNLNKDCKINYSFIYPWPSLTYEICIDAINKFLQKLCSSKKIDNVITVYGHYISTDVLLTFNTGTQKGAHTRTYTAPSHNAEGTQSDETDWVKIKLNNKLQVKITSIELTDKSSYIEYGYGGKPTSQKRIPYEKRTVTDLRALASKRKIKGASQMKKAELIKALRK
jgi:hypothetical protein